LRWRPGLHLAALTLIAWLVPLGYFVLGNHAHWLVVVIGLVVAGIAASGGPAIDRRVAASAALFAYGVVVAFCGLYILQFLDDVGWLMGVKEAAPIQRLILFAVLALLLLLAAMVWALATDNRAALWLAYAGFAVEVFMLYWKTFGSLLNTSLFFLVAAIIVSLFAWAAYHLHQRRTATGAAA
jgi:uncharacterized membrane protein